MSEPPQTRASLLLRLKDARDQEAWSRFVEIYGPLVYEYGRRNGLQDADAADLTQEVLRTVARSVGAFEYDPRRGSFRSWLFTVARTKRINLGLKGAKQPRGSGDTDVAELLSQIPSREAEAKEEAEWARAFDQRLLDWAAARICREFKESTWLAFWRTAFDNASPQQVASDLGMSLGAVYAAKSRVMARFRATVLEARFEAFDS
jgi:RNA polymerase sigma-70 factor (ECF subfamily)